MYNGIPVSERARPAAVIVCHCHAITEREIRDAVRAGARSGRQVGRACRAGRGCGGCQPAIREIVDTERQPALSPLTEACAAAG
jgi:bacterioferritin-associated ferredoxin